MSCPLATGGVLVEKGNYIVSFADYAARDSFRERVTRSPHFGAIIVNYLDEVPVAIVHDVEDTAVSELEVLATREARVRKSLSYAFAGK